MNELDRILQLSGQPRVRRSAVTEFAQQRAAQIADYLVSMSEDLDPAGRAQLVEYIKGKLHAR